MKRLNEIPKEKAIRMRRLAEGIANPTDIEVIKRYADWLEANPGASELESVG